MKAFFGEIPEALAAYVDYDAIARDLSMEFVEAEIAGERLVYACRQSQPRCAGTF